MANETPRRGAQVADVQTLQQRIDALSKQLEALSAERDSLQQTAQRTELMIQSGPFVIFRWIAAAGWPVEYVSENVAQLFGHSADAFLRGQVAFADVIFPADLQRVFTEVQTYSESGVTSFQQEYRIVQRSGAVIWLYDFTTIIRDATGTITHYYGYVMDITARKEHEEAQVAIQQQLIDAQQAALLEISTPLIPVSDNAMVMPIIGSIDARRAQQILETLLEGIASHHTSIAIIDITGVQIVDTQVARTLIQAAQAARLLGTQVILTGIRPEVAQTLVHLGADLHDMQTLSSLQAGIAYAFKKVKR